MAKTNTYTCLHCGIPFEARVADRNRGWARFHNKGCKASYQEARTGQFAAYTAKVQESGSNAHSSYEEQAHIAGMDAMEDGWDGHKNAF